MNAPPETDVQDKAEAAPASSAASFLAALGAAKAASAQPVPDGRDAARTLRQTRKLAKRALAPARRVRLVSLAPDGPSANLKRALSPLYRIRSACQRQRWVLELRSFARRNWKMLTFLAFLGLVWIFWTPILGIITTLVQLVPW